MNFQATINGHAVGYALQKLFPHDPGINGQWFSPAHAGEGFFLTEANGLLSGAYFTHYSDGEPVWYTCKCDKDGDSYTGPVYFTEGGEMGVPHDPLESVEVGTITFSEQPIVDPPPDPDPPPEPEVPPNPFAEFMTFRQKPFNWHAGWQKGQWYFNEIGNENKWYMVWSKAQILYDQMASGRNTVFQLEITALQDFTFLHTSGASGYGNPSIEGLPDSMSAGQKAIVQFKADKTAARPSPAKDANFQINTNLGTLVLYTAHIMGGQ